VLVLDRGGIDVLSHRSSRSAAMIRALRNHDIWPPVVATMVVAESLYGDPQSDSSTLRFLRTCVVDDHVPSGIARRAAELLRRTGHGTTTQAVVVALAEPDGTVLTSTDGDDLRALAAASDNVTVEVVELF
jgi:hypothetical protein